MKGFLFYRFISVLPLTIPGFNPTLACIALSAIKQMHNLARQTQPCMSLWRWSLALLLVCGFGVLANVQYPAAIAEQSGQSSFVTALDVPLAYNQHLSTVKRPNSHQKDEDNPRPWGLMLTQLPQRLVVHLAYRLPAAPAFDQSLNPVIQQPLVPRAPPLV